VHQSSVSATTIVEEPFDSDADADGFVSGSDRYDGAAAAHAPGSFPADDQFRPYADQQPEAGQVAADEDAEAEALTPEEVQVTQRCSGGSFLKAAAAEWLFVSLPDGEQGAEAAAEVSPCEPRNECVQDLTKMLTRPMLSRSGSKRQRPSRRREMTCTGRATQRPQRCARPAAVMVSPWREASCAFDAGAARIL